MRKLTYLDKKILIANQRIFEAQDLKRKKAHFLWFKLLRLNKFAKKYNIDLYAIPSASSEEYVFHWIDKSGKEKAYSPIFRYSSGVWSKELNIFKHLRETAPNGKIAFFIVIPYFEGAKIMRKDFYKEVGPCAHIDYLILNIK
jgi:hypothetical protein